MALLKEIEQRDGVITSYHRIAFIQITTNRQNSVVVFSYVSDKSRENEQANTEYTPYRESVTYETDYDPEMTIETAYDFLKTLPQFEGSEDI